MTKRELPLFTDEVERSRRMETVPGYVRRFILNVRKLMLLASCLLLLVATGCGSFVTGSNEELDAVHSGGPDCTQSGCHQGFGAAGTVFTNISSSIPVSGAPVTATNISNAEATSIGTTDSLGNFHYDNTLEGSFQMTVGSRQSQTYLHKLPHDSGCNSCHKWPPSGDPMPWGRLY